ncbi:MAG: HAD family hydrolase [Candidatus Dependentiae bacterium]|jgi:FMN phosphatase YigB (HAD superfamily)
MDIEAVVARARGKKAVAFDIFGVLVRQFKKNLSQPFAMARPVALQHTMTWQEVFTLREELLYSAECLMCRDHDACVLPREKQRYPHVLTGVTTGVISWQQLANHVRTLAHARGYDQLTQEALALICHPSSVAATVCPHPQGAKLLDAIKKEVGASRCYILSNISLPTYQEFTSEFEEVFSVFPDERVCIPGRAGAAKPDPAIFEYFLTEYDLQPQECLFIDDTPRNVAVAQEIGIDGVLFE